MREWNYVVNHPASLIIAADARSGPLNGMDDQVWELNFGNSEPPAVSLQTTFGLRARSCRIFPRFTHDDQTINNPKEFLRPIIIHRFYPNYINCSFKPFHSFNVILEYWVPDSQSIACRTRIINTSRDKCSLGLEWAELLVPTEDGHRMSISEIGVVTILEGRTANLSPVLFMTGGATPGASPYPSLDLILTLLPHQEQDIFWAHSALAETGDSFAQAKKIINKNWDNEISRILRINSRRIEISTGDQDWDSVFYLSETLADQLLIDSAGSGSAGSYVKTRKPDNRTLPGSDGSGFHNPPNGDAPLSTYHLMGALLLEEPDLFKTLLHNSLTKQVNAIDLNSPSDDALTQPRLLATPIFSRLAWEYYQSTGNKDFLQDLFPELTKVFDAWFTKQHDRDDDSIPEWDQPAQTGFEENPLFSFTGEGSLGLDITTVESPDLCSYLFSECQALINIAAEINFQERIPQLEKSSSIIQSAVDQAWDDEEACYLYRDRDSHIIMPSQVLATRKGEGIVDIHQDFINPIRPHLFIRTHREGTRAVQIYVQGITPGGSHRVDHIHPAQVHWQLQNGYVTSKYVYTKIEQIEVTGLSFEDEVTIRASGYVGKDVTMLLPLWAGLPSAETAKVLVNLSIMNKKRFLSPYGIRSCANLSFPDEAPVELAAVRTEWMNFVIKGLLRYGEQKKAAELFTRMMKAAYKSLSHDLSLHQYYHDDTGKGFGEANTLSSLVPVGLFMEILGIKIFTPTRIEIEYGNPFPWPVTIKYRGLTIVHQEKKSLVIFSDGQSITIDNQMPAMVNLEISD